MLSAQNTKLFQSIWSLTFPQLLMMICQFLVGFTDVWVAGQIDPQVQASFGLIVQCMTLFMVVGMAFSSGALATISQSLGAGEVVRARRYVTLVLGLALVAGLTLAALGFLFDNALLQLLMVPESIRPVSLYFLKIALLGLPAQYLFIIASTIFRASKDIYKPLLVSVIVCLSNAAADLGFGLGWWGMPNYGYAGIAWSSLIAVACGALISLLLLSRTTLMGEGSWPTRDWLRAFTPYLLRVAGPAGLGQVIWQIAYLVLFGVTATLPYDSVNALAGLTAGMRMESIIFLPAMAFTMTASILVGHSLGAGKPQEAKRLGLIILISACSIMSLVALPLLWYMEDLAHFLSPSPAVQGHAYQYLRFNILSTPFTVASMTLNGIMTGAGATVYTLIVGSLSVWLVRLPLAWLFGHIIWEDATGVFMSMLVSQMMQAAMMFWIFQRKNWMAHSMRHQSKS